jgi:hypothetical protein
VTGDLFAAAHFARRMANVRFCVSGRMENGTSPLAMTTVGQATSDGQSTAVTPNESEEAG